jgi:phage FluMu protein Com
MPIRFRCVYCNQLLGIARRKAGTVVRCPHCSEQLIVPSPTDAGVTDEPDLNEPKADLAPAPALAPKPVAAPAVKPMGAVAVAPAPANGAGPRLFERSDFEDLLQPIAKLNGPPVGPGPGAVGRRPDPVPAPPIDLRAAEAAAVSPSLQLQMAPAGVVVSPLLATILSICFVIALAVAFLAGFVTSRMIV